MRSEGFYNLDDYVESWKIIDRWLQAFGMFYYPSEISIADNSMRYSVYSSVDVMKASEDELENPYRGLFKEFVLDLYSQSGAGPRWYIRNSNITGNACIYTWQGC